MWSDWSVWVSFLFFRVFSQSCRRFSTGEPPTPTPKLEKTELFSCCLFVDDVISIVQSALVISSGRGLLPGPRPLPFLLVTGGGYLGYKQYQKWGQGEDGAPPPVATPTQVKWKFSLMSSHLPCNTEHVQSLTMNAASVPFVYLRRVCSSHFCDWSVAAWEKLSLRSKIETFGCQVEDDDSGHQKQNAWIFLSFSPNKSTQ